MKKKILSLILGSSSIMIIIFMVIIIACLMVLDFFGANVTDGYVENNMDYAQSYITTLNKNIKTGNGYVSLERILYFYLENDTLTFDQIYYDNLDKNYRYQLEIGYVCQTVPKYTNMSACANYKNSSQINLLQAKPFNAPMQISNMNVTSFFMQERVVFGEYDVHNAWDFSSPAKTPLYSVCDGTVSKVSFTQTENKTNKTASGGNTIVISCPVDDITYEVTYAHLFPNSGKVKVGDKVTHWQEIASVGTTGYSTGNHLHYEVKLNGQSVDGMSLIDFTNLPNNQSPTTPVKPQLPNPFVPNVPTLPNFNN